MTVQRDAYREAYARHWNSVNTSIPGPDSGEILEVDASVELENMVDVILTPAGPGLRHRWIVQDTVATLLSGICWIILA